MKNLKSILIVLFAVLVLLSTTACDPANGKFFNGGANIVVKHTTKVSSKAANLTAVPDLSTAINHYAAELNIDDTFIKSHADTNEFSFSDVEVGTYSLVVNAYKDEAMGETNLVASKKVERVDIKTNTMINTPVNLEWLSEGQGSLDFKLSFPSSTSIDKVVISGVGASDIEIAGTTAGSVKKFNIVVDEIETDTYPMEIKYYNGENIVSTRQGEAHIYANLTSYLEYSESTDLSKTEAQIVVEEAVSSSADGSLGNPFLNTDSINISSNITSPSYKIYYKVSGETVATSWIESNNAEADISIPNPDSNGCVSISAFVVRNGVQSETVTKNFYFETKLPTVSAIASDIDYNTEVTVSDIESDVTYSYQIGTDSEVALTSANATFKLNNVGPLVVKAKKGNFLENSKSYDYDIKLPAIQSAIYNASTKDGVDDILTISYGTAPNTVFTDAKLYYKVGTGSEVEVAYDATNSYTLNNLIVDATDKLKVQMRKTGWTDSDWYDVKSESSFSHTGSKDPYYTGAKVQIGSSSDTVHINNLLAAATEFNFTIKNNEGNIETITNDKFVVSIDGSAEVATNCSLTKNIDDIVNKLIVVKVEDSKGKKYAFNFVLQKDNTVDANFEVKFTYNNPVV